MRKVLNANSQLAIAREMQEDEACLLAIVLEGKTCPKEKSKI